MKVKFENNVLTVVSSITKETIDKGIASLKIKDDKDNEAFAVGPSREGNINTFYFGYNAFIEDKAAVVAVLPMGTTLEDVQRNFGEALVEAKKYTELIATQAMAKEATIAAIFED